MTACTFDKLLADRDDCHRREMDFERRLWRALHWVLRLRKRRQELNAEMDRLIEEQRDDYEDVSQIVDFAERARNALVPFAEVWASVCEQNKLSMDNGKITMLPRHAVHVQFHLNWYRDAWRVLTHFPKTKDDKMGLYEYTVSGDLDRQDIPFYALIMAAMRRADSDNLLLLQRAFPETWEELQRRYDAPGGRLPHEADSDK
jgi:hypothetical protein